MDLILYDGVWYRSETKLHDSLLMSNFEHIIRVENDQYHFITPYGKPLSNGSFALLKMKWFSNGIPIDDFPMFYPMHTRWGSSKLYIDDFGDLIEEAVPAGEYHES